MTSFVVLLGLLMMLCYSPHSNAFTVGNSGNSNSHHHLQLPSIATSNLLQTFTCSYSRFRSHDALPLRSSKSEEDTSPSNSSSSNNDENIYNNNSDEKIFERAMENHTVDANDQKDIMDELKWRSAKVNLEEANERAFQKKIKSRPWKLPYDDAVSETLLFFSIEY